MAEYIEREDLIRRLELSVKSWSRDCNSNAPVMVRAYEDVLHRVKNLPTADVVDVVRCKDCKNYVVEYCTRDIKGRTNMFYMQPTDFCSYGEKRSED